ncbi:hypothetical protein TRVL_06351 [Trypanosoma vivax]|nr:hypothetical protein TRVL_06351 [Trypanosoma vivax]
MSTDSFMRRERRRQQLRKFYGGPETVQEPSSVECASNESPELCVSSESFSLPKYAANILQSKELHEILEIDTKLVRSARRLDVELRELVYKNYSKFIAATETIRELRDSVTEMDVKLQTLSSNVESIDRVSSGISSKLQEHRSRIEQMVVKNRMVQKMEFLFGLPDAMRRCLEKQAHDDCVKYWVTGSGFLVKHSDIPSIAKVHKECEELARQLYDCLWNTVHTTPMDTLEAMDGVLPLVDSMRLLRTTSIFSRETGESAPDAFEKEIILILRRNIRMSFSDSVQGVLSSVKAALTIPNLAEMDLMKRSNVLQNVRVQEVLAQLKSYCSLFCHNSDRVCSLFNDGDDDSAAARTAEEVQIALCDVMKTVVTHMSELLVAVVESIACDTTVVSSAQGYFTSVFAALSQHLQYFATTFKTLGINHLGATQNEQDGQYATLVGTSVADILQRLALQLTKTAREEVCLQVNGNNDNILVETLHKEVASLAMKCFVYSSAANIAGHTCLSPLIEANVVPLADIQKQYMDTVRALMHRGVILFGQLHLHKAVSALAPFDAPDPTSAAAEHRGVEPPMREMVMEWGTLYNLLKEGIFPVLNGVDAPTVSDKPQSCGSPICGSSLRHAGPGSGRSSGRPRVTKPIVNFNRQNVCSLQTSVDHIFSKQSKDSMILRTTPRECHPATVLACVVVYVMKGLVEYAREQTFSRCGFQCMQVNCTFLLHVLTSKVQVPAAVVSLTPSFFPPLSEWLRECSERSLLKAVPSLIDECCTCAYERCTEKLPLTAVVAERLVQSVLGAMEEQQQTTETGAVS